MLRERMIIAAIAALGFTAGCGGDDEPARVASKPAKQAAAPQKPLDPDKDPYLVTCADLAHPQGATLSRRAPNTLAAEAKIKGMSQLQASTAIYFGMTELCKSNPGSYKPATDAVAGAKSGKFRSDL